MLCGLLAAAPLWGPGIVNTRGGGDSPFLLQRTVEMAENLRHGIFPPRWMAHAAYDLGYPFFNHYAALPYYISGGLTALGTNILSATQATQTLGFLAAAAAMGLWSRRIYRSRTAQLLAIAAYTFAPFHLANVYVRGDSLSEFYAFVWYPLILWALDRAAARPSGRAVIVAGLAYGGLIITHNTSAMSFSPFALIYALVAAWRYRPISPKSRQGIWRSANWIRVARTLAPFAIGILLTAWFWLPAVAETRFGQMGADFTEGYFHYSRHFRGLNLVQRSLAFDYSVAGSLEASGPFAMGLVQAAFTLAGCAAVGHHLLRRRGNPPETQHRRLAQFVVLPGLLALSTLMITPLSKPLWDHLPLLELTQFPWRFLSVQAVFTAIITGAIAERAFPGLPAGQSGGRTYRPVVTIVAVSLLALSALISLQPDRLLITPEDVTREDLLFYEAFTGNIGTTIRYEYLPRDVVPRLYISEAVIDGTGSLIADGATELSGVLIELTPAKQVWDIRLGEPSVPVSFPLNWWPGWRATLDGAPVECYPMEGSGRLTMDLPTGAHIVELRLRATPLQRTGAVISLLSFAAIVVGAAAMKRYHVSSRALVRGFGLASVIFAAACLGPLGVQHEPLREATFFDFNQMPYPHMGPVDFGTARLGTVQGSTTVAGPGDRLEMTLKWDMLPAEPLTATLRLVSPAEPRHGVMYTLAESVQPVTASQQATLILPDDLTRGLYLVELRLWDTLGELHPRTGAGRTMGTLYVGQLRVPEGPQSPDDAPILGTFEDLSLLSADAEQAAPGELHLRTVWSTRGTPRNWRFSLRVLDLEGRLLAQQDRQPGYGYLPTTLWHAGESVVDYAILPLPVGLAPGAYMLRIVTYLQATMRGGGEVNVPVRLDNPTLYDLQSALSEQTRSDASILCQSDGIALLSLNAPGTIEEGDDLAFDAEWNALLHPSDDLEAAWTLVDEHGNVVGTTVAPLAIGSRTSDWPRLTWVVTPIRIDLPIRLDAGTYTLGLALNGARSGITSCGAVATLDLSPRPRSFTLPTVPHSTDVTFGDTIRLLGYDASTTPGMDKLTLTIWWQATRAPMQDYKRFVHLYNPVTEEVVSQDDAMPRDWTYPTTLWIEGEVVSETVSIDLTGVPQGLYSLGLGWYDPDTVTRLTAVARDGESVQSDRLTLSEPLAVSR